MNRKTIRIILICLLAAVFAVSAGMMVRRQIQYRKTLADTEEAARIAGLQSVAETPRPASAPAPFEKPEKPTEEPAEETPGANPLPEEALDLGGLDLEALRAYNEDVLGWIAIPGTAVSYPLVRGEDNQYYLTRSWKRESISSGAVFMDFAASRDLTDFHTIVYGHRMRDGTMFGSLGNYGDPDYWREHPSVYIVLDDAIYRYDIFSAQEAGVKGIVYRNDIEENHLEEEFVRYCTDYSVLDTGLTPDSGGRFLTLSTCTGNGYASRWVVHGVLAGEYGRTNT